MGRKFSLEGRARGGHDIDGFEGKTTDLQALAVVRWTLFNGGIKEANVREQQQRENEVHGRLFERTRAAEEDVRSAWSRLQNQTALASELETQGRISDDLLLSYREQFNIGRRSLLDVLDAQNSRYNVQAAGRNGAPRAGVRAVSRARVGEQADPVPRRRSAGGCIPSEIGALPTSIRSRPRTCDENSIPTPALAAPPPAAAPAAAPAEPMDNTPPPPPAPEGR